MIKIILIKKIKNNNVGDIINVRKGFANNFLIPFEYALIANNKNINNINNYLEEINKNYIKKSNFLEKIENKIINYCNNNDITFYVKSLKNKLLYIIKEKDIIFYIKKNIDNNINIKINNIFIINKPIKNIGKYEINIKLNKIINIVINILKKKK
ncbi:50S ribosomal protein L9 [Candidatus Nardonella dryophthoridicola]|uniref:Large ribosomal subunit protein bL9 n=1 Tax=endosymbiont of Rhynchophorus ferrugineus TaxID=1972133 RepID=A0A2Z5T8U4_9GAMM|nr:50S ribosomal protein L9 [Candidatus Nardonella dryophthoridicola]QTJ62783.1 50S ribosomal protein L9 [Candidatus Nardonella dryophthoridicola]BBA85026.1 50S ribosomal protein L9 [endosymbiont of Rhynchophorus ferrugineus]